MCALASDGSEDKYGRRANLYANARPDYPISLVEHLAFSLRFRVSALDVGAGSGQLSVLLSKYFKRVVAIDKSEAQLSHGPRLENVTYRTGVATALSPLVKKDDQQDRFDLVTCAQVYHWFIAENIDKQFLMETCRVLNPEHGRLAIFGYGICTITSSEPLQQVFQEFYINDLGSNLPPSSTECCWDVDRQLLDNCLEDMPTHAVMEIVERRQEVQRREMTIAAFLNYVRTFSGLANLQKKCAAKGELDPMEKLHRAFEANAAEGEVVAADFPFFLIVLKPL